MPHPLDPNLIFPVSHEHFIYADDYGNIAARVDEEDYQWAIQWRWHAVANSRGKKFYLKRTEGNSKYGGTRGIYLHVAIHERRKIRKPSRHHTMVDHGDGDSLNCRRYNLSWATPSMNARNINGQPGLYI